VIFETPRSTTLRPLNLKGYVFPRYSRMPSPQLTPTPMATDVLSSVTFPLVSLWAGAVEAAVRDARLNPRTVRSVVILRMLA